jgi:hypothetical protein
MTFAALQLLGMRLMWSVGLTRPTLTAITMGRNVMYGGIAALGTFKLHAFHRMMANNVLFDKHARQSDALYRTIFILPALLYCSNTITRSLNCLEIGLQSNILISLLCCCVISFFLRPQLSVISCQGNSYF